MICVVTIPSFTALFFMAGKYSLFHPRGLFRMNNYGCCTQALLFRREKIPDLVQNLRKVGHGPTDTMIENYADETMKEGFALR